MTDSIATILMNLAVSGARIGLVALVAIVLSELAWWAGAKLHEARRARRSERAGDTPMKMSILVGMAFVSLGIGFWAAITVLVSTDASWSRPGVVAGALAGLCGAGLLAGRAARSMERHTRAQRHRLGAGVGSTNAVGSITQRAA